MKSRGDFPEEFSIAMRRAGGDALPRLRFEVIRPLHGLYWSFDTSGPAERLCRFLAAGKEGAHVFDNVANRTIFQMEPAAARS